MAEVEVKDLLLAGVHFGHQTRRWNPKMRRYIFGERSGNHIIDLDQSAVLLKQAVDFAGNLATGGGIVLFVGTKKQARDAVRAVAEECGMPYVNHRWLGGLLTNYHTISKRIKRLHELNELKEAGQLDLLPVRERLSMEAEQEKLELNLGGVSDMPRLPEAIVVIDLKTEEIGVREAARLGIPMIGLVDTNCDPDPLAYPVPGNDDSIKSCEVVVGAIGDAVKAGRSHFLRQEEKRRQEEEERQRREAEERARREAEEEAKRQAEEEARQRAEQEAKAAAESKASAAPAPAEATAPAAAREAKEEA